MAVTLVEAAKVAGGSVPWARLLPENQGENPMTPSHEITRWQEGQVDRSGEHMELRYGSAEVGGWEDWIPVALVGPPAEGAVDVEFLVDRNSHENTMMIDDVVREVQFYLIDKCRLDRPPGFNPWAYAVYHCGTGANLYSPVHWSYVVPDGEDSRLGSLKIFDD
jgi:hypothetical protein